MPSQSRVRFFLTIMDEEGLATPEVLVLGVYYIQSVLAKGCPLPFTRHTWRALLIATITLARKMLIDDAHQLPSLDGIVDGFDAKQISLAELMLCELLGGSLFLTSRAYIEFCFRIRVRGPAPTPARRLPATSPYIN
jgi:hypothetical protein